MLLLHLCKFSQGRRGFPPCEGAVLAQRTLGGITVTCPAACEPHPPVRLLFLKDKEFVLFRQPSWQPLRVLGAVCRHRPPPGQRPSLPLRLEGIPGPLQQHSPSTCPQKQFHPCVQPLWTILCWRNEAEFPGALSMWEWWLASSKPKLVAQHDR